MQKKYHTMKLIKISFLLLTMASIFACGPSQEEIDKQDSKKDSLMEIERNSALDNADKLLKQQDSIDAANDTTTPEKK